GAVPERAPADVRHRGRDAELRARLGAGDGQHGVARLRVRRPSRSGRVLRARRRRGLPRRAGAVGRVLGSALRRAARSRRHPCPLVRSALNLVEEEVELDGALRLSVLRPPDADALIDETTFDEEEFLPYWAELWPSGLTLARHVAALDLAGRKVLELGC